MSAMTEKILTLSSLRVTASFHLNALCVGLSSTSLFQDGFAPSRVKQVLILRSEARRQVES